MKQVLQNLRSGALEIVELPSPLVRPGALLIRSRASLISAGTERMLLEFSQANLVQKARLQPERVKQVLDKIRTDGLAPTLETVFRKLDQPLPLGYCNAGTVIEAGAGVEDLRPGDAVVSNGPHAEIVCVPRNLCARIPEGVAVDDAAFAVPGSIALQGLRLAAPALGERFMVFGAGLLGLITVQLLRASGCMVMAVDIDGPRLELAGAYGAETVNAASGKDPIAAALAWTAGRGVDGVLITASAKNDEIVHQSAQSCRQRGRIVLVGVVGMNLRRSDFYEKELSFQVSCSYGPGRYDEGYEQGGRDYPYGHVRWTEQRNFGAVLEAIRAGRLIVHDLITDRFPLGEATAAYGKLQGDSRSLGVVLQYPDDSAPSRAVTVNQVEAQPTDRTVVGVVGAGNFARSVLLPALSRTSAGIAYVASRTAADAHDAARKYGAEQAVSDYRVILDDPRVNAVFVVVGHDQHARLLCEALEAGKHVFVEKPLAISDDELARVTETVARFPDRVVMVGFNRRFSPHTLKIQELLATRNEPLCMSMTVNAGMIPPDHWIQDPLRGGGRIIGEACHFIDLLSHFAESPVRAVSCMTVGGGLPISDDRSSLILSFENGSIGTLNYFANGSKSYPKETLEIFSEGRVLRNENFRVTRGYGFRGFRRFKTVRQDKGHIAEISAFVDRIRNGGGPLIPFQQLRNVTQATFAAVRSARENRIVTL